MQDTFDYIRDFGSFGFDELPFNEVDNLNLCQSFYMPIEKVSPQTFAEEPKPFDEVWKDMFSFNGNKHVGPGLVLNKKISVKMMDMANSERYKSMKVIGVREVYKERPAVQFCGGTFLLPDGTIVVVFRGTDDTIVGWKEDVDILTKKTIPSHQLALDYMKDVSERFPERDIIICGHSKGGNVALYAGLASEKKIRDRIVALYNNEGPGFDSYAWFSTPAYKELLPKYRHFVPTSSMIGMMLAHDDDYEVIKNKHFFGLMQHDITFWRTEGDRLLRAKGLNFAGKFSDRFFNKWLFGINEAQRESFDRLMEAVIMDGIGAAAHGLLDVPKNIRGVLSGTSAAYRGMDESDRDVVRDYMSDTGSIALGAAGEAAEETIEIRRAERSERPEAELGEDAGLVEKLKAKGRVVGEKLEDKIETAISDAIRAKAEEDDGETLPVGAPMPA